MCRFGSDCHRGSIPDMVESLLTDNSPFTDMTTFDLLCGSTVDPGVTPIKFAKMEKDSTGE